MLRFRDRHEREMLYGPTNEELITQVFRGAARSYRDLPRILYHIQWKFRDEIRPRFGVMRGREFLMKDAYSFDMTTETARHSYSRMFVAYLRTFARMGLKSIPMVAETGPIGGDLSHEFIILADTGESKVFCHADLLDTPIPPADVDFGGDLTPFIAPWTRHYAATDDKHDEARFAAEVPQDKRVSARGVEIGHIFFFGTKYSEPMGCRVQGPDGSMVTVQMGSYGIGVSRLPAAIIEASHDDAGIVWPVPVAPFEVGVVNLKPGDKATDGACEGLYGQLQQAGVSVLYDDTQERPGGKFATMDLIGLPFQLIVGPKGLKSSEVEMKDRKSGARTTASPEAAVKRLVGEVGAQRILA
jgi:prolyl-tRNA synthetase